MIGGMRVWVPLAAILIAFGSPAKATTCPAYPNTLSNGTTADATQVMANFNSILTCANASLAPLASPSFTGTTSFAGNVGIWTTSPLQRLVTQGQGVFLSDSTPPDSGNPAEGTGTHLGFYSTGDYGYLYAANNGVAMKPLILNTQQGGFTGNIGIGTTNPGTILDVESAIGLGGTSAANLTLVDTTSQAAGHGGGILFDGAYTGTTQTVAAAIRAEKTNSTAGDFGFGLGFYTRVNGSSQTTENLVISSTGNVGIGTTSPAQALEVVGTIRQTGCTAGTLSANASGDIICTSDARLKDVLGNFTDGLGVLSQITPKRFTYKPTKSDPVETFVHAGFIAQNVRAVIPEASAPQRDGYLSLDTTAILAATVNAIKELKATNDNQAAEIAALRTRLDRRDRKLAALMAASRRQAADLREQGAAIHELRISLAGLRRSQHLRTASR